LRLIKIVSFASLGALAGCGGCNSCFGTAEPGDDAATVAVTPTAKPVAREAAVAEEDAAPAKDAGGIDAADAAFLVQPALTLTIRPPMPKGPIQSCGVYDGPLCQKDCEKGNCRQDCDGVECELACTGGYCTQFCGAQAKCRMTCRGGHCLQVCAKQDGCIKECLGGDCT
jgi:hypothetical protein